MTSSRSTGTTSCNRSLNRLTACLLAIAMVVAGAPGCGPRSLRVTPAPALDGHRIMLLPVRVTDPPALDAELAARLPERSAAVEWVLPQELQLAMDRAPALRVRLDAMPREIVDGGRMGPRLVDPAYGTVRLLGAVVDATLALVPVAVRQPADATQVELELTVALVDIRGGQVLWIRSVRGQSADGSQQGAAAAVAEALARTLVPAQDGT